MNRLKNCFSNCGPQTSDRQRQFARWSVGGLERKISAKIVSDIYKIKKSTSIHVCAKTAFDG
jgi:hypothetical protein